MPTHRTLALITRLAWLAATASTVQAAEPLRLPGEGAGPSAVESCVSRERIDFGAGAHSVVLDERDRVAVHVALLQRYPVLLADGFTPAHIVLSRQPGSQWIYVTLLANPTRPQELCFTATFAASRLEVTPALLEKYFAVK